MCVMLLSIFTDYGLRITDYRLQITEYGLQITEYGLQIMDYRVRCMGDRVCITEFRFRFGMQLTKHSVQFSVFLHLSFALCSLSSVLCSLFSVLCTLFSVLCTLYSKKSYRIKNVKLSTFLSAIPVPRATQRRGSFATWKGMLILSVRRLSSPRSKAPPPVSQIPFFTMSA